VGRLRCSVRVGNLCFLQDTRHVAHVKSGMRKAHQELTTWSSMQQEHFIFWVGLRNSPHGVVVFIVEGCSWPLFVLILQYTYCWMLCYRRFISILYKC
jgi:hypothetical protein